jgi:hypothetical protein
MESVAQAQPTASNIMIATDYGSWFWFLFITGILAILWYIINTALDIAEVRRDWPKYRCSPSVMPFASLYGFDTQENFNYCLNAVFQGQVGGVTGPFMGIFQTLVQNMMGFLKNLNSLRIMMATLVGGVSKILQESTDRFRLIFSQAKITSLRMQMLMRRVFGTMFSVLYMGLSGITAGVNFGDTFIFKFMDTFCFAPETYITLADGRQREIQQICLGDVLVDGSKVVSVYRFAADGQSMVKLGPVTVSTNHFVLYEGKWMEAKDHPDAEPADTWSGGVQRPLICLDTDTHHIPLDKYIFSDWDETSTSDAATMRQAERMLNGGVTIPKTDNTQTSWLYQPAFAPETKLLAADGTQIPASQVLPGTILSTGRVVGIGRRLVNTWLELQGEPSQAMAAMTPSTLLWCSTSGVWKRAGELYPDAIKTCTIPRSFVTLVVMSSATVETATHQYMRDMCEVHSRELEAATIAALCDPTR